MTKVGDKTINYREGMENDVGKNTKKDKNHLPEQVALSL